MTLVELASNLPSALFNFNIRFEMCFQIKLSKYLTYDTTYILIIEQIIISQILASVGDYDPAQHTKGYINNFKELLLLPKDELVSK